MKSILYVSTATSLVLSQSTGLLTLFLPDSQPLSLETSAVAVTMAGPDPVTTLDRGSRVQPLHRQTTMHVAWRASTLPRSTTPRDPSGAARRHTRRTTARRHGSVPWLATLPIQGQPNPPRPSSAEVRRALRRRNTVLVMSGRTSGRLL